MAINFYCVLVLSIVYFFRKINVYLLSNTKPYNKILYKLYFLDEKVILVFRNRKDPKLLASNVSALCAPFPVLPYGILLCKVLIMAHYEILSMRDNRLARCRN